MPRPVAEGPIAAPPPRQVASGDPPKARAGDRSRTLTAPERTRLDRWLWYARFFKTRALARRAVEGGRVHVGGSRAKPGRAVRPGDRLEIQRGEERFEVTVRDTGSRRGPASEARQLYEEDAASAARRAEEAARRRALRESSPGGGRPDKRDRRRLRALRDGRS